MAEHPSTTRRWRLSVAEDPQFKQSQAGAALASLYIMADLGSDEMEYVFGYETTQSGGFGGRKATLPGSQTPIPVTFQATFQSKHNADGRLQVIERDLQQLATRVPELGRPPRCLFQWAHRSFTVWVKGVSIKHEGTWLTGLPRRMTASITLEEFVERTLDTTRQGEQPSTQYHSLLATETPEHLALYYLGDPELGVLVRRDPANAGLTWEEQDKARILPRANSFMRQRIAPAAPPFAAGWQAVANQYQAEREGT